MTLFPYICMYVRAFRGLVGACVCDVFFLKICSNTPMAWHYSWHLFLLCSTVTSSTLRRSPIPHSAPLERPFCDHSWERALPRFRTTYYSSVHHLGFQLVSIPAWARFRTHSILHYWLRLQALHFVFFGNICRLGTFSRLVCGWPLLFAFRY